MEKQKEETRWIWYSKYTWDYCDKDYIDLWGSPVIEIPAKWSRKQVNGYLRLLKFIEY